MTDFFLSKYDNSMKYVFALFLFLSNPVFHGTVANADEFSDNDNTEKLEQLNEKLEATKWETQLWLYAGLGLFFGPLFGVEALGGLEQINSGLKITASALSTTGLLGIGTGAIKLCQIPFLNRKIKKYQRTERKK